MGARTVCLESQERMQYMGRDAGGLKDVRDDGNNFLIASIFSLKQEAKFSAKRTGERGVEYLRKEMYCRKTKQNKTKLLNSHKTEPFHDPSCVGVFPVNYQFCR